MVKSEIITLRTRKERKEQRTACAICCVTGQSTDLCLDRIIVECVLWIPHIAELEIRHCALDRVVRVDDDGSGGGGSAAADGVISTSPDDDVMTVVLTTPDCDVAEEAMIPGVIGESVISGETESVAAGGGGGGARTDFLGRTWISFDGAVFFTSTAAGAVRVREGAT
jgi:hypothetical protein